jgi:IclR family acetate operon transcriptional repressor
MSDSPKGSQAIDRALRLLSALVASHGTRSLSDISKEIGLPISSAHRIAAALEANGFVARKGRGRFQAGIAIARSAASTDWVDILSCAARPMLRELAQAYGMTAHLGIFEGEMVTYLVQESASGTGLFTKELGQLEAYCSAIGKVLLAGLPESELKGYLECGALVPLTANTIVEPAALKDHLRVIRTAGYAIDQEEIQHDLFCVAVPLSLPASYPRAAISLAGHVALSAENPVLLSKLKAYAGAIERALKSTPDPLHLSDVEAEAQQAHR